MKRLLLALTLIVAAASAGAIDPHEILDDPILEARAREIGKGLRCLVCQNQSIDDSDATLARDMRILVRERLVAGDTNQQVTDYIVSRYGDFVLLKPKFTSYTMVLWLGPAAIAGLGIIAVFVFFRRRPDAAGTASENAATAAPPPLSDKEKKRLKDLMDGGS